MERHKPRRCFGIAGAIMLAVLIVLMAATPALAFPDVPAGHAYEDAIDDLSSWGIIGGYANGKFGLNDPVKRMQFAKMIVGTLDIVPDPSTATRFTDLGTPDANGYPHKYVQAAYDNGITYGTNPTQTLFSPSNPIRRDQVVSMIVRGADSLYPGALWDPVPGAESLFDGVGEPHGENLRIAEYNGLLQGLIGMGPAWSVTANATRGEVAQMLWNLLDLLEGGPATPSGEVWVYADGSGDYPTIEAAVADAVPETLIHLGAGTFTLTETLVADFNFGLAGNGMEGSNSTTIEYAGDVVYVDEAAFWAQDICFVCTAVGGSADVITVNHGDVTLTDCFVAGGTRWNDVAGDGLYLYGNSVASVYGCVFAFNDLHGIEVDGISDLYAEGIVCSENGHDGICFWDESTGFVVESTCDVNGSAGIMANDYASIEVRDSAFSENLGDGIALYGEAYGELTGNICDSNVEAGIYFAEASDGIAADNECSGNHWGIYVDADSYPEIGQNDLYNNTYDLYYE